VVEVVRAMAGLLVVHKFTKNSKRKKIVIVYCNKKKQNTVTVTKNKNKIRQSNCIAIKATKKAALSN
jgi:hypothetical protein